MENMVERLSSLQKYMIVMMHDTFMVIFALVASVYIRLGEWPDYYNDGKVLLSFAIIVLTQVISIIALGLYKGIWRYSSTHDLVRLIKGSVLAVILSFTASFLFDRLTNIPRSMFLIDWLLLVITLGGGRLGYRLYSDHVVSLKSIPNGEKRTNVIIVGAGSAGEQLFREIKKSIYLNYNVVGFTDDDPNMKGRILHGLKIFGHSSILPDLVKSKNIEKIFVAIPSASSSQIQAIVETCRNIGVEFKILPHINDILDGKVSVNQLRDVRLEDLLGRKEITLDSESIESMIAGSTVMVTGAGGSIGSELCKQIARYKPKRIVFYELTEYFLYRLVQEIREEFPELEFHPVIGDVRAKKKVERVLDKYKPELVFHAAAYKHVPMMEANPSESIETNVLGTKTLAESCCKHGVKKFVMISTDKAVNPTNVMGASKRIAELVCQKIQDQYKNTEFITVRFGNVLGSSGSVVPLFKKQIAKGGPITLTHPEIERFFMTIPEACQLVLQAGAIGQASQIMVLDMGKPVKIKDLAKQLISLSGNSENNIEIKYVGLRPGEKLYEELLLDSEHVQETVHPLVKIAKVASPVENFDNKLEKLFEIIELNSFGQNGITSISEIVPEFSHQS